MMFKSMIPFYNLRGEQGTNMYLLLFFVVLMVLILLIVIKRNNKKVGLVLAVILFLLTIGGIMFIRDVVQNIAR